MWVSQKVRGLICVGIVLGKGQLSRHCQHVYTERVVLSHHCQLRVVLSHHCRLSCGKGNCHVVCVGDLRKWEHWLRPGKKRAMASMTDVVAKGKNREKQHVLEKESGEG